MRIRTMRADPQAHMRIPRELLDLVDKAAKKNGCSRSAEIVKRLWMSFAPEQVKKTA